MIPKNPPSNPVMLDVLEMLHNETKGLKGPDGRFGWNRVEYSGLLDRNPRNWERFKNYLRESDMPFEEVSDHVSRKKYSPGEIYIVFTGETKAYVEAYFAWKDWFHEWRGYKDRYHPEDSVPESPSYRACFKLATDIVKKYQIESMIR